MRFSQMVSRRRPGIGSDKINMHYIPDYININCPLYSLITYKIITFVAPNRQGTREDEINRNNKAGVFRC